MNTIPTIFNERIPHYTAVGGKDRASSTGICAVILNRAPYHRGSFFADIEKTGFDNIISIESASPHYDIEELSGRHPTTRFILPEKELNLGEQINLAASEAESPLFFVLRSDMRIIAGGTSRRMAERLSANEFAPSGRTLIKDLPDTQDRSSVFKRLCTIPVIVNTNYETLPSVISTATHKKKLKTVLLEPRAEGDISLYPFDGIGIYDRQRFIQIGGFDITINKDYWQLMDFGFRSYLWGEEIALSMQLKVSYEKDIPIEDYSVDKSYARFHLKNLSPVFKSDYAHLPYFLFPAFHRIHGEDIFSSFAEFKEGRNWVKKNKYRWKCDAKSVIRKWGEY